MQSDEYKSARKKLGYKVDEWIKVLDISRDLHKSYCAGRRRIILSVEKRINMLLQQAEEQGSSQ